MVKQKLTTKTKQNKIFFLTSELTCSSLDENVCRQKGMYRKKESTDIVFSLKIFINYKP